MFRVGWAIQEEWSGRAHKRCVASTIGLAISSSSLLLLLVVAAATAAAACCGFAGWRAQRPLVCSRRSSLSRSLRSSPHGWIDRSLNHASTPKRETINKQAGVASGGRSEQHTVGAHPRPVPRCAPDDRPGHPRHGHVQPHAALRRGVSVRTEGQEAARGRGCGSDDVEDGEQQQHAGGGMHEPRRARAVSFRGEETFLGGRGGSDGQGSGTSGRAAGWCRYAGAQAIQVRLEVVWDARRCWRRRRGVQRVHRAVNAAATAAAAARPRLQRGQGGGPVFPHANYRALVRTPVLFVFLFLQPTEAPLPRLSLSSKHMRCYGTGQKMTVRTNLW